MSLIQDEWKNDLYKYITGIIKNDGHKLLAINGTSNHLHIFIGYQLNQLIPELLQDIKGSSSRWIHKNLNIMGRFSWQEGYGAFSYSHSQIDNVIKYINNQEMHHKRQTFMEEYLELLRKFNIPYEEKYILREIT